jgi:lipopolysaccharide cholinephosphotransferase
MMMVNTISVKLPASFFCEEERSGYTVSGEMKNIWAVELDLWQAFDAVCQRHGLRYYAAYGTLLGTVRHGGFVPWDDDIDLCMMREDYEKLKKIAPEEFREPYFFQDWYNSHGRTWCFSKLRNSNTAAVEFPDKGPEFNQGMFIDINAIDDLGDEGNVSPGFKRIQRELYSCINNPVGMLKGVLEGQQYALDRDTVVAMCNDQMTAQRCFEQLTLENAGQSDYVGYYGDEVRGWKNRFIPRSAFDAVEYMDFEGFRMPVPAGYDTVLRKWYGDGYMTPRQVGSCHEGMLTDPFRSYGEYVGRK